MPQIADRRLLAGLSGLTVAVLTVFAVWPGLDLAASAAFFDPATGSFALAHHPLAEGLRKSVWGLSIAGLASSLGLWLASLWRKAPALGMPARAWGFIVALYALGPGLLVETLLKGHWGRARPAQIAQFGGTADFTPAYLPADECARNCSFVAGEMAGATTLLVAAAVVLAWTGPRLPMGLRWGLVALALACPVIAGGQRLAAGRHFLSDILLAGLFIALLALVLARVLKPLPGAVDIPPDSP